MDRPDFRNVTPMKWLTRYTMADVTNLKMMPKPWYCLHEDLTQSHGTTTIETTYHFFCFALLHPGKGINEFQLDQGWYLMEVHDLAYNNIKGDVLFKARKRPKALGLFLDNNSTFLFQYRVGMHLVKNLAKKAAEEHKWYVDSMGLNYLSDIKRESPST